MLCRRAVRPTARRIGLAHSQARRPWNSRTSSLASSPITDFDLAHHENRLSRNIFNARQRFEPMVLHDLTISRIVKAFSTSSDSGGRRDGGGDVKRILSKLAQTIHSLERNVAQLPPLAPVWRNDKESYSDEKNDETRRNILFATRSLVEQMRELVDNGTLRPTKHSREMAVLLEHILKLYSQCKPDVQPTIGKSQGKKNTGALIPSVFEECQKVLNVFHEWNLQNRRQRNHDIYAMLSAANEHRWKEASDLFLSCINPNETGYSPFDVDVSNPVPLYAVARHAQQHPGAAVVENVMQDAVHPMTLVSPTDEERYILAAGTALGLAGEWEALVQYLQRQTSLRDQKNSSSKSQPLVAATMQACLLCNEPEQALRVFDSFFGHEQAQAASEWLWAGGQDRMSPLCRDLAMRALGACAWNQTIQQGDSAPDTAEDNTDRAAVFSARALEYFHDAQTEGMAVSLQALEGVAVAYEYNGQWHEAVELLLSVISSSSQTSTGDAASAAPNSWVVRGEELDIKSYLEGKPIPVDGDLSSQLGPLLETAMRACNAAGQFGIAMLCLRLWSMSLQDQQQQNELTSTLVDSLLPLMMSACRGHEHNTATYDLLRTAMVSLSGVRCTEEAAHLYEAVGRTMVDDGQTISHFAHDIYDFAISEARFAGSPAKNMYSVSPWEMVDLDMRKLSVAWKQPHLPDDRQRRGLLESSAAAQAIRQCTSLGQPLAGIYWLASTCGTTEDISKVTTDVDALVQRLNWVSDGGGPHIESSLLLTDSLLSSIMEAYTAMDEPSLALKLFEALLESNQVQSHWIQSRNALIDSLYAFKRDKDANVFFEDSMASSIRNPDTFSIAASWLSNRHEWSKVENTYQLALSSSCISENLCLQAIKAVSEKRRSADVKMKFLRSIVDEVAKLMGMTTSDWIESKYWDLKSQIRFGDLRGLLWWADQRTAFLDELELAIGVFEKRRELSLTPKHAAIRAIVRVAKDYHEDLVPPEKTQIPRVPRNLDDWTDLITRVLREAEGTSLLQNQSFVEDAATALQRLGREDVAAAWRRQVYLSP